MNPCTCHISNLRCKNEKCEHPIIEQEAFKTSMCYVLEGIMRVLKDQGFDKKTCVKALRRELNHKDQLELAACDEIADKVFIKQNND